MSRLILFNKPYGVICQFTREAGHRSLADFIDVPRVYPAGRLDTDSEGLVLLTDDGALQTAIADPRHKLEKRYWVQVEGEARREALEALRRGVPLRDGDTLPARVHAIPAPPVWERDPPIRARRAIPTAWLDIGVKEGRNRQVRRMTAHVGLPTLRLVRFRVGAWDLGTLAPGQWVEVPAPSAAKLRASASGPPPGKP
jgi:23S rRNA pseudouridine2457 synthase